MGIELSQWDAALSYSGQKQFDCGQAHINTFVHSSLKQQVKKNLSVAYVLTDADADHRFVGFYTIAQHTIGVSLLASLQLGSLPRSIPCSRLVMLGIDKAYQRQQLGQRLVKHALGVSRLASQHIGSYGLYLDANALAIAFYLKLGFVLLEDRTPASSPMFIALGSMV